jgi:parvulin-like peptidyl-prolyl isomerase
VAVLKKMTQIIVNGEPVSPTSIEQERKQLLNDLSLENTSISDDRLRLLILDRAKQNVIDHYLFKQEAIRRKIQVDETQVETQVNAVAERNGGLERLVRYLGEINETIDDFRMHVRERLLVDMLVEQIYDAVPVPKDKYIKRYFKEHKETFNAPEQVQLQQIVKSFRNLPEKRKMKMEIDKISAMIKSGKSFILMVRQKSDLPQNDGQLGWVTRGQLDAAFDEFAFNAEPGAVSEPVEGPKAWYLLRLVEKQLPVQKKLEEVKSEISQLLQETNRKETLNETLEQLRKKAVIKG